MSITDVRLWVELWMKLWVNININRPNCIVQAFLSETRIRPLGRRFEFWEWVLNWTFITNLFIFLGVGSGFFLGNVPSKSIYVTPCCQISTIIYITSSNHYLCIVKMSMDALIPGHYLTSQVSWIKHLMYKLFSELEIATLCTVHGSECKGCIRWLELNTKYHLRFTACTGVHQMKIDCLSYY